MDSNVTWTSNDSEKDMDTIDERSRETINNECDQATENAPNTEMSEQTNH